MTSALTVTFTARATNQTRRALTWWEENRPAAPDLLEQELRIMLALVATAPTLGRLHATRASRTCGAFFCDERATTSTTA